MSMSIPLENWGATPTEIAAPMPGDDLIDAPPMSATRAIDLAASPDAVHPWLTQMGFGRAGWYSYDLIDNLGRRSATMLHPEWQVTQAGQAVPGGPIDFTATIVEAPQVFVLSLLDQGLCGHRLDFTLAYRITAAPTGSRLVCRARAQIDGPLGRGLVPALCLGDGVMVRRQLIGIERRTRRSSKR